MFQFLWKSEFMGERSVMKWILAQQSPLGSNPAVESQTAGGIPELVIILIILLMIATAVALITQRLRIPYASFGVNTFIFLLIGIEINPVTLWSILPSILFVILAYQLGRILSIYPLLSRWA
jgi:hypothetical protein